jgi:hypothetical protein
MTKRATSAMQLYTVISGYSTTNREHVRRPKLLRMFVRVSNPVLLGTYNGW